MDKRRKHCLTDSKPVQYLFNHRRHKKLQYCWNANTHPSAAVEQESPFCPPQLWYLCWCVTLKHQSTHLYRSAGFINMPLSDMTDAPFTSWDPTGLVSLWSFFTTPPISPSSFVLSFFGFNPLLPCSFSLTQTPPNLQINQEVFNCHADEGSAVSVIRLKRHVWALSWHLHSLLLPRDKWEWIKGGGWVSCSRTLLRGHMVSFDRFGCHGDQTQDLCVWKRTVSSIGQPVVAVKWLIIMQKREIQAPIQTVLENKWLIELGQTLKEPQGASTSPAR